MVPTDERPLLRADVLLPELEARGWLSGRTAGERADELVEGGFVGMRVDEPPGQRLYANGQGGFRVCCPVGGGNVVPFFQRALSDWRGGGPRELSCPVCERRHDLAELVFQPAAVFGRGALVLLDVANHQLRPTGLAEIEVVVGPFHTIGSRR